MAETGGVLVGAELKKGRDLPFCAVVFFYTLWMRLR